MLETDEKIYKPLSLTDWLLTLLITMIPGVNIVLYIIWSFGANVHPSKKNWARACLLLFLIFGALALIFAVSIFGGLLALLGSLNEVQMDQ